jgi:meiotic recombination protein REC8, fungi type
LIIQDNIIKVVFVAKKMWVFDAFLSLINTKQSFQLVEDELSLEPEGPNEKVNKELSEAPPELQKEQTTETSKEGSEYKEVTPARKKHRNRQILKDDVLQIRKSTLKIWNDSYLSKMQDDRRRMAIRKAKRRSKNMATYFVYRSGIGNIGAGIGQTGFTHPLAQLFSGDAFLKSLQNRMDDSVAHKARGIKRSYSHSTSSNADYERRRTRIRLEEGSQIGRGDFQGLEDQDYTNIPFDLDASVELARDAVSLLEEHSTQMPWNTTQGGSIHSSLRSRAASILSTNQPGSTFKPPSLPSLDRRASRLPEASPLFGRSRLPSQGPSPGNVFTQSMGNTGVDFLPGGSSNDDNVNPMVLNSPEHINREFELFGPAAVVSTQQASSSQWLRQVLNTESENFLVFVHQAIETNRAREVAVSTGGGSRSFTATAGGEEIALTAGISFEALLPPKKNSKIVAAQAFLHVLTLANRGALRVHQEAVDEHGQDIWWGTLWLGLDSKLTATEVEPEIASVGAADEDWKKKKIRVLYLLQKKKREQKKERERDSFRNNQSFLNRAKYHRFYKKAMHIHTHTQNAYQVYKIKQARNRRHSNRRQLTSLQLLYSPLLENKINK